MQYDVIIIGAGPGGIFAAYELAKNSDKKVAVFEGGNELSKRKCPIDGDKVIENFSKEDINAFDVLDDLNDVDKKTQKEFL